jgi:hypothetical protein
MDYTRLFEHIGRYKISKASFKRFTGMTTREINDLYNEGKLSLDNAVKVCQTYDLQPSQISEDLNMTLDELRKSANADRTARFNARLQYDLS